MDGTGAWTWLKPFLTTSVGNKFLVAVTGIGLVGFVIGHMIGNLLVFSGPDAINGYAKMLKSTGGLLWIARGGLLAMVVVHVALNIRLKLIARKARPIAYAYPNTIQASRSSRTMMYTGSVVLAFILFHLLHFTWGTIATKPATVVNADGTVRVETVDTYYTDLRDRKGDHDVYSMVVDGFRRPAIAAFYILAQLMLFFHLKHGVGSVFQTLGVNSPRFQKPIKGLAFAVSLGIFVGNTAIVAAILAGFVPEYPSFVF